MAMRGHLSTVRHYFIIFFVSLQHLLQHGTKRSLNMQKINIKMSTKASVLAIQIKLTFHGYSLSEGLPLPYLSPPIVFVTARPSAVVE